ncbi:ETC complex I subunit conserved region-domain-containing protein [Morchella snyderi]|nr:ETC complex I subunit conserved region-domain-containing protein [Morchella snyderi]
MHPTLRLLTARLPPFSPTGLTGLLTHPNPRPTLIALYNHTLTLLARLPAHSVYRQSVENLTRHRLAIISSVQPDGLADYHQQIAALKQQQHSTSPATTGTSTADELDIVVKQARLLLDDFAAEHLHADKTIREYHAAEHRRWTYPRGAGAAAPAHGETAQPAEAAVVGGGGDTPILPVEPPLSAEQVAEVEAQFGGGLIEEVVDQGWAELKLVSAMEEARVWEELEVVPEEGQWVGFERKA